MKVKNKEDIIKVIKSYEMTLDQTYHKGSEHFLLICDFFIVNSMCFREIREIRFVEDTMWIDDKASIDVENIEEIDISFCGIRYDKIQIITEEKDDFTLE